MLCPKCGAANPTSRAFCRSCASSLWPTAMAKSAVATPLRMPQAMPVPVMPLNHVPPPPTAVTVEFSEYYGIRGWLLWFCFCSTVLVPIGFLYEAVTNRTVPVVAVDIALAALSVFTGITLWRRGTDALKWVEAWFIVQLAVAGLAFVAAIESMRGFVDKDLSMNKHLEVGIRILCSATIWYAYFKKSKRVRANYGRNL